ncbi:glutathione-dependent disulfide-bond oxidoreductase [Vibrio sp.]|nr:glutathione-dependent disulfide-bond oxidoreductase [Vibrio sp.]
MTEHYQPPKVWQHQSPKGDPWAHINRPIAGATHDKELPLGQHPIQLYSLGTPNGQKVTILLEELLAAGITEAEYDAHLINIGEGDQFGSGFVDINPNSKIPALLDTSVTSAIPVFESGSILYYLADKFNYFLPKDATAKTQVMNWLFWLHGAAPFLGGGFGHFYAYAADKQEYPINRYTLEIKRQLDLLDKHLEKNRYFAGEEYSIADIAIWPWYGNLALGELYNDSAQFLDIQSYTHFNRWVKDVESRPAVQRGRIVNKSWGEPWEQLKERHSAQDIDDALAQRP